MDETKKGNKEPEGNKRKDRGSLVSSESHEQEMKTHINIFLFSFFFETSVSTWGKDPNTLK